MKSFSYLLCEVFKKSIISSYDITFIDITITEQDRQYTHKRDIQACSYNHSCRGKISVTYSERMFVALGVQHTICILSSVACPALQ